MGGIGVNDFNGFYGGVSRAEFNERVARFLWLLGGRAGVRVGISLDAERRTITDLDLDLGFFSFPFFAPPFFFFLNMIIVTTTRKVVVGYHDTPPLIPYFLLPEHISISSNNNYPFSPLTAVSMAKAKLRAQNTVRRASTKFSRSSRNFFSHSCFHSDDSIFYSIGTGAI